SPIGPKRDHNHTFAAGRHQQVRSRGDQTHRLPPAANAHRPPHAAKPAHARALGLDYSSFVLRGFEISSRAHSGLTPSHHPSRLRKAHSAGLCGPCRSTRRRGHTSTSSGDSMTTRTLRIAMNGITGRMGYRQHLLRSILPIRAQGGVQLPDGDKVQVEPVLVGRRENALAEIAAEHDVAEWTTDLDAAVTDPRTDIVFDASMTSLRPATLSKAMRAGKHIFTEKPTAESLEEAIELARLRQETGVTAGVVHDNLYLPGLVRLRRLVDEGFFGRILSLRGEFGYWVFEGEVQPAQRPSWNYRAEDGGGMTTDM